MTILHLSKRNGSLRWGLDDQSKPGVVLANANGLQLTADLERALLEDRDDTFQNPTSRQI